MDIITPQPAKPAKTPPLLPTIEAIMKRPIFPYVEARLQSVSPVPYELQKARAGAIMYEQRTKYHLRGGKISGIVDIDIATKQTYPAAATQKGILSLRKISSRFFSSNSSLEALLSAKIK